MRPRLRPSRQPLRNLRNVLLLAQPARPPAEPAPEPDMIPLAWRFLRFQKDSALARWYQARTADRRAGTRKTMIVALARKLLIALWRFVTTGETLEGVVLRPAA